MKIQVKTEVNDGRVFRSYIYTRETLKEWFWIFISEGEACPYYYLPVYKSQMKYGYYAMPALVAPFGLVIIASYFAFWSLWKDIVFMVSKWNGIKRVHEQREEFFGPEINQK